MARTPSTMLPLGTVAPPFRLPDSNGQMVGLADFEHARCVVVAFICNHCPYVVHLKTEFSALARSWQDAGATVIAINSNDFENPKYDADHPRYMRDDVREYDYTFPYLVDQDQSVAQAYQAACTPDFYVFDADRKLVYRGQFDASRPGNDLPVTGADLDAAVRAVLARTSVPADQLPSVGCNIKWKPGNEPKGSGFLS